MIGDLQKIIFFSRGGDSQFKMTQGGRFVQPKNDQFVLNDKGMNRFQNPV
jgi:hypothetical protein